MRGLHQFAALSAIGIHATDTHTDPETASNAISQKTCPDQQFSCDNGQTCLDLQAVCDGISDCKDKSDETRCSSSNPKPKPTQENTKNSKNSPEDLKKTRLRRQFPDYNYDLYDGFDFPSTDFPLLDYGTTDTLDLFGDFNFETTPNPLFAFGGGATTAMPLFGGGFTTAMPSFGFGTTAIPSFNLATTEAAFPIFATPTPGFAVETTPMLSDFGLATTVPSFPALETTAAFDFGFGPQTTTAGFEFGAPTTSVVTTAIPNFGAPTTTMADFGPVETTPLSLLQTTEPEFATTVPPTTEPLLQFQQTTQPLFDINTTMEPTTVGFAPTTQPIQPATTAGLLPLQTTTPAGMLCSDGSTVPLDKICDGFSDCPGGDDEGEASNCPVIMPLLTTAPDLDFGLPTTVGPNLFPTTADPFGNFDPFDPSFLQTTAPPFILQTTAPSFIFESTQAPSQYTTDGFGFGNLDLVMTTAPDKPQTTQYYQQQTTDSISFNEVNFNNVPNPPVPTRSTTQTPMMTKPPSVEAMGEYGEENFARFVSSFEIWRENVFDKWLSTAKTYKQRAMRDQGPPKSCPKQGRDSCANGRRTCTDDLDGCLYCYCRIDQKKDTHEAVVREYEEDIKFWKDVLEPQWKEMWEQWEDQWEEYERDEL